MSSTHSTQPTLSVAERIAAAKAKALLNLAKGVAHSAEPSPVQPTQTAVADTIAQGEPEPAQPTQPEPIAPEPVAPAQPSTQYVGTVTVDSLHAALVKHNAKAAAQTKPSTAQLIAQLRAKAQTAQAAQTPEHSVTPTAVARPHSVEPVTQTVQTVPSVEPIVQTVPSVTPSLVQTPMSRLAELKAKLASVRIEQAALPEKTESLAHKLNEQHKAAKIAQEAADAASLQTDFAFNEQQLAAIALAQEGRSFCLIGAAGTGKTTAVREIVRQVLANVASADSRSDPVALVSFTNRAVRNIRKAINGITETKLRQRGLDNCKTIHKLLAFAPKHYEVEVPTDKGFTVRNTMRFEPTYTTYNPLSHYKIVIVDEASMLGLALFKQLIEACPNAIFIFIGDLNQLKPVMDDSILGYKLGELPVIELTQVYRQALDSPIVGFQHRFTLAGKQLGDSSLAKLTADSAGQLVFQPIKIPRSPEEQARVFANAMLKHMDAGEWTPCTDAILLPNYKGFGSYWVSLWIAQELGRRRGAIVHEVQCTKHMLSESPKRYLAVGDFVIHGKEEYFIADIRPNAAYTGRTLQPPNKNISRIGTYCNKHAPTKDVEDFESVLWDVESDVEQREVCSHFVTIVPANGQTSLEDAQNMLSMDSQAVTLNARKEVGDLEFGYAITVHKSQGSEWRKVFLAVSRHAKNMLTRELLYTAMTRAKEQLHVYYSPDSSFGANDNSISKCIRNQEIKGATWRDKVATFNLRRAEYEVFMMQPTEYGVRG